MGPSATGFLQPLPARTHGMGLAVAEVATDTLPPNSDGALALALPMHLVAGLPESLKSRV